MQAIRSVRAYLLNHQPVGRLVAATSDFCPVKRHVLRTLADLGAVRLTSLPELACIEYEQLEPILGDLIANRLVEILPLEYCRCKLVRLTVEGFNASAYPSILEILKRLMGASSQGKAEALK